MNGPVYWQPLLRSLEGLPVDRFVIAGGCVRDFQFMLGQTKDIDICIPPINDTAEIAALSELVNSLPNWTATYSDQTTEGYEECEAGLLYGVIRATWTFNDETFAVDIISRQGFHTSAYEGAKLFDWGILQCWYDQESNSVLRTELGQDDFDSLTATLNQGDKGLIERSLARFAKFDERHPGYLIPYWADGEPIDIERCHDALATQRAQEATPKVETTEDFI